MNKYQVIFKTRRGQVSAEFTGANINDAALKAHIWATKHGMIRIMAIIDVI